MGVQDRDWYWKDRDEKERAARAEEPATTGTPVRRDPNTLIRKANRDQPPKLWGSDWHWSIQLLVWLSIAILMLIGWRLLR